jgi:ketosteroid isomerase-like protein
MKRVVQLLVLWSIALSAMAVETPATKAARNLLSVQQAAWNRADIDGFMKGYWNSEEIRFAGGADYRYGWQATIDRYRKTYPDAATMGKLDFDLVEVREMTPSLVYVFGKWHLTRANEAADKAPHGLFTLIVEKKKGEWYVTRDHTSSAEH